MEAATMNSGIARHLEDEDAARYCMGKMSEEESAPFEEHLLICSVCRDRVTDHDLLAQAIRKAAPDVRLDTEPRRLWTFHPAWMAAVASIVVAVGLLLRSGIHPVEPETIRLEAMRGLGSKAAADRPLRLQPDLKGLTSYSSYRLSMVNELGGTLFETQIDAAKPLSTVPGVPPGIYFVRIHSPAGELLREYVVDTR